MNPKSILMFLAVLMAGVLGGAAAYQAVLPASSADGAPRESLVIDAAEDPAQQPGQQSKRAKFAKCRKPAVLEAGKCVTEVVRTVAVPGSSTGSSSSGGGGGGGGGGQGQSLTSGPQDDEARPEVRDDNSGHGNDDDDDDDDDDDRDDDTGTHTNTHSNTGTNTGTSTRTRTGH